MYRMTLGCWAKRWTAAALLISATAFLTAAPMAAQASGTQAGSGQSGSTVAPTGNPATLKMAPAQSAPTQNGQATGQGGQTTAPVLVTPSAQGQQEATPVGKDDAGQYVIRRTVNEVNLVFTVTDKSGHFVKNLKQTDFELLDARKPPEKILRFEQQTNLPLRIGILIDTSSSIHSRFTFEQSAAIDFLQSVLRPQRDLAFVMGFDTTPELTQGYTSNVDKLAQGIHGLKSNGGTALFDAVYKACRDELLPEKSNELVRKAIVLLSDGHDNQSHVREDEAVKMCQRAETIIYTISTNISPSKDTGDETLARLSDQTGGRSFVPIRDEDVSHAFLQIEDELRSQYALEYRPADFKANGEFRAIWLVPVNRKYQVRAKKGYFAPR
jgi:Ca-activated chloride channel homolog